MYMKWENCPGKEEIQLKQTEARAERECKLFSDGINVVFKGK